MNEPTLKNLVMDEAYLSMKLQAADGSMPAGHNGPYHHKESALRNTGHWLFIWAHLWKLEGDERFRDSAEKALGYLLQDDHRPQQANWMQRQQKGRDFCNGVIGAAWTGEALWAAVELLESEEAFQLACAVFRQHTFNTQFHLWHRLDVNGEKLSIDQTFNHQLWFAATTARLVSAGADELKPSLDAFLNHLDRNFVVEKSGLIRHRIALSLKDHIFYSGGIPFRMYQKYKSIRSGLKPVDAHARDLGYHAFNLHAFAILHRYVPEHAFWQNDAWKKTLSFAQSEEHIHGISNGNPYAYPYNPVGFEMAFALQQFVPDSVNEQEQWIDRHCAVLTQNNTQPYGSDAADPITAKARLYEAVEWFIK